MGVLDNVREAVELLDDVDNMHEDLIQQLSVADKKIDYWEHMMELETIPVTQAYKIIKEMKRLRISRREAKNELELLKVFRDNQGKLCNTDNRKMLLSNLYKTSNKQQNAQYSYDAYTTEELEEVFK